MQESDFNRRILVVDDETAVRNGIAQVLTRQDLMVTTVADAAQAQAQLARRLFAIVLLDIKLPDLDGVELLKLIRRDFRDTEVIMITGYPTIQGAVECIKLGALDYLVKPFRIDELEAVVQKARDHLSQKNQHPASDFEEAKGPGLDFIVGGPPPATARCF
jgi:DNA-binding NtrC family response regulator